MTDKKERLIRLPEVCSRVGLQPRTIYKRVADGIFPKPISLGYKTKAWRESDIDTWIDQQIATNNSEESS